MLRQHCEHICWSEHGGYTVYQALSKKPTCSPSRKSEHQRPTCGNSEPRFASSVRARTIPKTFRSRGTRPNSARYFTFRGTWTSSGCVPLRLSSPCACAAPRRFRRRSHSLALSQRRALCHYAPRTCVSWRTSLWSHVFLPVLRRSWFFQENSATKRVSMGISR